MSHFLKQSGMITIHAWISSLGDSGERLRALRAFLLDKDGCYMYIAYYCVFKIIYWILFWLKVLLSTLFLFCYKLSGFHFGQNLRFCYIGIQMALCMTIWLPWQWLYRSFKVVHKHFALQHWLHVGKQLSLSYQIIVHL